MKDKDYKKQNPAIDKVKTIMGENNEQEVINPQFSTDNGYKQQKNDRENRKKDAKRVKRTTREVAERGAKLELKKQRHAEKLKLKKAKAEHRAELKRARQEERAYLKRVKAEQDFAHKTKRSEQREKRRDSKRKRGVGGWLAAVVSLGAVTLILGSLLTVSMFTDHMQFSKVNTNSATSQRAFYDFVGYVDSIETNMSKMFVSTDSDGQQKVLGDIIVQSSLADSSLAELPILDESKYLTSKYINQLGDYAKYLNNRLIDGETLTEEDISRFRELYSVNQNLKITLSSLSEKIDQSYDFSELSKNDVNDEIIRQFKDIENNAMDYPEMIYDGPFSDGIQGRKPKGISGEEINELQAIEIFEEVFLNYGVEKVKVNGMANNGEIECYNVVAETEKNGEVYAQITKRGGKIIMFNAYKDCVGEDYSEEQCVKIAEDFLEKLKLKDMTCVWAYSSGGTEYLNFAYQEDGVVCYPDMVKVKVCRERGVVSGIDADLYYMNHTQRTIEKAKHGIDEAYEKVNKELNILSKSLAIIPTGGGNEKLAYEFIGEANGETFYIYIDANTLKQADIFKVVNTKQGRLLI